MRRPFQLIETMVEAADKADVASLLRVDVERSGVVLVGGHVFPVQRAPFHPGQMNGSCSAALGAFNMNMMFDLVALMVRGKDFQDCP